MYKSLSVVLAVLLAICGDAWATPGNGVVETNRLVSRIANIESLIVQGGDSGQLQLHQKIGSDKAPVNIVTSTLTFAPGGFSGWHSHTGPGWVVVESGTASFEEKEGCFVDYPAGWVIFEAGPTDIHNLSNRSATENLVIRTWFFPLAGLPGRIDQQPVIGQCDAPH
jgi:quercetin dioxygenase-like cupin family protein